MLGSVPQNAGAVDFKLFHVPLEKQHFLLPLQNTAPNAGQRFGSLPQPHLIHRNLFASQKTLYSHLITVLVSSIPRFLFLKV